MKTKPKANLRELRNHLETAQTYLEDGAPHSARAHLAAALLVLDGKPVPKGAAIWELAS